MADFEGQKPSGDAELENFLMMEKQKAQVNAQVSSNIPGVTKKKEINYFVCFSDP